MSVLHVVPVPWEAVIAGTSLQLNFTTASALTDGCLVIGFSISNGAGATIQVDAGGTVATSITSNGGILRGYALLLGSGLSVGAHTVDISWTGSTNVQAGGWIFSGVDQTLITTSVIGTTGTLIAANPATLEVTSVAGDMTCSTARVLSGTLSPDAPSVAIWGGLSGTVRTQGAMPANATTVPGTGTTTYSWTNSLVSCRVSGFNIVQTSFSAATSLPAMNMLTGSGGMVGREYM